MQIRCPHCQNGIELVDDSDFQSIDCPSCGSQFGLVDVEQNEIDTLSKSRGATSTIGHFELIEEVGRGAFGTVWRARDAELDRQVAVKIPREHRITAEDREQFLREARAAAQLSHPNIVTVYEVGRDGEQLYIVSDFVKGVTLAEKLVLAKDLAAERLSPRDAVELCVKIAAALEHAHESGVIHRDMKPSNVMLTVDDEPHVMDFGLAKREAGEITMTVEGKVLGTPAYMPPEQASGEGHHVDRRADVYSLGVILYELLAGDLPFRGNTRMLLHQVIHDEAPSPRKLNNAIPRDLETITLKCLQKDPGRRYQSAQALADDLTHWLEGKPITARPVTWMERSWRWCKRKPAVAGLATVSVAALLAIVALIVGNTYQQRLEITNTALRKANQESETQRLMAEDARDAESQQRKLAEQASERARVLEEEAIASRTLAIELLEQFGGEILHADPDFFIRNNSGIGTADRLINALGATPELAQSVGRILLQNIDSPIKISESTDLRIERLVLSSAGEEDDPTNGFIDGYRQQSKLNPDNQQYKADLAHVLLSYQMDAIGCVDGFDQDELLEARDIFQDLSRQNPAEPTFKISLGDVHQFMGLTRAAEDFELDAEGSGYCQRAIDIFTGLASEYPDEPLYRMRLARAYNSFGCANYHVDELEELEIAPGIIDKAIAIYARLVDEYPDEPLYQQGLALAYSNLGCIRSKLEQADLAIDSYRKAISIYESLCADENLILGPTIWQRRISLDSTHNDLYAIKLRQIYNLSSTYQGLLEHLIDDQSTQVTEIKLRLAGIAYLCEFNAKKPIATGIAVGMHFVLDNLSLDYPSPFLDRLATLEHPNFLGSGLIKEFGYEFIDSPPDNLDKCQEEVIKTGERLIRENPSQLSYRAGLAILLREICAKRYERGQVGEAVSIQQKVVEIFKQIYTVHPPMFYSELSGRFHPLGKEYQLLADLQRETGQLEQAAATVQAMITILHSSRSYELPFKYLILADLQEEMGQLDDAIRSRNSCISTYRLNVSGARPWIRSQECYDLACLFSLSSAAVMKDNNLPESKRTKLADKHAAHAMELLKDAGKFSVLDFKFPNQMGGISGSYRPAPPAFLKEPENVAHMKQDPDLDPLRERDDFKKLVKKLEEDLQK